METLIFEFSSFSLIETENFVNQFFSKYLMSLKGAVLLLEGQLGSGKTKFCQILGKIMGVQEIINSPSFNLYNIYFSPSGYLCHFDLYRLTATAIEETEFRELWYNTYDNHFTIHAIEWWEKAIHIESLLPKFRIKIEIHPLKENHRKFKVFQQ